MKTFIIHECLIVICIKLNKNEMVSAGTPISSVWSPENTVYDSVYTCVYFLWFMCACIDTLDRYQGHCGVPGPTLKEREDEGLNHRGPRLTVETQVFSESFSNVNMRWSCEHTLLRTSAVCESPSLCGKKGTSLSTRRVFKIGLSSAVTACTTVPHSHCSRAHYTEVPRWRLLVICLFIKESCNCYSVPLSISE